MVPPNLTSLAPPLFLAASPVFGQPVLIGWLHPRPLQPHSSTPSSYTNSVCLKLNSQASCSSLSLPAANVPFYPSGTPVITLASLRSRDLAVKTQVCPKPHAVPRSQPPVLPLCRWFSLSSLLYPSIPANVKFLQHSSMSLSCSSTLTVIADPAEWIPNP